MVPSQSASALSYYVVLVLLFFRCRKATPPCCQTWGNRPLSLMRTRTSPTHLHTPLGAWLIPAHQHTPLRLDTLLCIHLQYWNHQNGDNLLYLLRTCWLPGNHWEERLERKLAARALLLCRGSNPFMWCVHCTESKINVCLVISALMSMYSTLVSIAYVYV